MLDCPRCGIEDRVKNGIVREKQRYQCKSCGCNYTQSSRYRISADKREEAIDLYLEGVGFRGIERFPNISHVTVMRWVKALADKIDANSSTEEKRVAIMELDEMWHFFQKKHKNVGCGLLTTETASVSAGLN